METKTSPTPRYALLPLQHGWVIYDCSTHRIVDGVYTELRMALDVVYGNNNGVPVPTNMTPNAEALGLIFRSWTDELIDEAVQEVMNPEIVDEVTLWPKKEEGER